MSYELTGRLTRKSEEFMFRELTEEQKLQYSRLGPKEKQRFYRDWLRKSGWEGAVLLSERQAESFWTEYFEDIERTRQELLKDRLQNAKEPRYPIGSAA